MTTIRLKIFGEDARRIEKYMKPHQDGDIASVNTTIFIAKRVIKGRTRIELEFDL